MLRGVLLGEGGWGPKGGGSWRRVRGEGRREVEADAGENGGVSVKAREELIALLRRRGVKDERVLGAMGRVPREVFVPSEVVDEAYRDVPLPIGRGQTISQPFIVAEMTAALAIEPGARVLEIGTGCGYQTAVLVELGAAVFTIELEPELGASARERLLGLGYHGVEFRVGDGRRGLCADTFTDHTRVHREASVGAALRADKRRRQRASARALRGDARSRAQPERRHP